MSSWRASAFLIFLACGCATARGYTRAYRVTAAEQLERAVSILVVCREADASLSTGRGSGVLASGGVVTALHVVTCDKPGDQLLGVFVEWKDRPIPVVVQRADKGADVAKLVPVPPTSLPLAGVRVRRARVGEAVCAVTSVPKRARLCGQLTDRYGGDEGYELRMTIPIVPGNSGSGLYDEVGNLIGVVTRFELLNMQPYAGRASDAGGRSWLVEP